MQCLQNPDASKAKLISRMAKMGQPMLPFLAGPASHPDSSDSELEVRIVVSFNTIPCPPTVFLLSIKDRKQLDAANVLHHAPVFLIYSFLHLILVITAGSQCVQTEGA